jgi:hypothetical protein
MSDEDSDRRSDRAASGKDWVMGDDAAKSVSAQAADVSKVEDQYYRDYADHWKNFIKGINVKPYKNKDEATDALQTFSSANSPMKILLTEVAKNTNLSAKIDAVSWWDWIKSFVSSSSSSATAGTTPPEKEFRPLFTFVGRDSGSEKLKVDQYQTAIGNVFSLPHVAGSVPDFYSKDDERGA